MDDFLEDGLLSNNDEGYLAWHSTAVYTYFAVLVEDWVKDPSGKNHDYMLESMYNSSSS